MRSGDSVASCETGLTPNESVKARRGVDIQNGEDERRAGVCVTLNISPSFDDDDGLPRPVEAKTNNLAVSFLLGATDTEHYYDQRHPEPFECRIVPRNSRLKELV
ncbi:hypothetical protein C8Q78DRAFT_1057107 [Trametes maxima]|nr:hypothetical protein C8Q78DRAFT_1057107 [Trametes maxima]